MIDVGIITGSGIFGLPGAPEPRVVETPHGETSVAVFRSGPWTVGSISRHGEKHHHLPHTIPHRANVAALAQLGARAVLAVTAVGMVDPRLPLGRPMLFDDLYFPENRLPGGEPCTMFVEPGEKGRGHLVWNEPFSPRLRERTRLAAGTLGLQIGIGGVYAHTSGPRFETGAEIKALGAAGVSAVSQTCGPEAILAGEMEMPYCLIGFPVNRATGTGAPETKAELDSKLSLAAEILPRLLLRTAETLTEADFVFDYGYVYRFEEG